ncbi:13818_t:CDS:1, partial [Dentiscutata heterogama]
PENNDLLEIKSKIKITRKWYQKLKKNKQNITEKENKLKEIGKEVANWLTKLKTKYKEVDTTSNLEEENINEEKEFEYKKELKT